MRSKVLVGALLVSFAVSVNATLILSNDFSTVTAGTYNGTTGQAFGVDPVLGNASGFRNNMSVTNLGVSGSAALYHAQDVAIRSREQHDITQTITFSAFFHYDRATNNTLSGGFFGMGWAIPSAEASPTAERSGTDGRSQYNDGQNNRMLIGVREWSNGTVNRIFVSGDLAGTGAFNVDATTFVLTSNHWYEMSFDLAFTPNVASSTNRTLTLSNLVLLDRGIDGTSVGTLMHSIASTTLEIPDGFGINLNTETPEAYAFIAGNGDRGVKVLDNIAVIPEPGAAALLLAGGAVIALLRRRRTCS